MFRGESKAVLRKPLKEVVRFEIDRSLVLSRAETRAASGADAAITAYRQALAEAAEPWLRDPIRVRLLCAYDRAGRFDDAGLLPADFAPPTA